MSIILLPILALVVAGLLGWIWPLTAGIIRTRRGNKSVGLIVFGGIWSALSLLPMAIIGIGIFTALQYASTYDVSEFSATEYENPTAEIVVPYKSESDFTATSSHDNSRYRFRSTNGTFIVPASTLTPQSYSISAIDEKGKTWTASWFFHSHTGSDELNLETNSTLEMNVGPPLNIIATRKDIAEGKQHINITVTDSSGNKVSLRAQQAPSIEILDKEENIVWTHKLSYG